MQTRQNLLELLIVSNLYYLKINFYFLALSEQSIQISVRYKNYYYVNNLIIQYLNFVFNFFFFTNIIMTNNLSLLPLTRPSKIQNNRLNVPNNNHPSKN